MVGDKKEFNGGTPDWVFILDDRNQERHNALTARVDEMTSRVESMNERMGDFERRESLCEFKMFGGHGVEPRLATVEKDLGAVREEFAAVKSGYRALGWAAGIIAAGASAIAYIKTHLSITPK